MIANCCLWCSHIYRKYSVIVKFRVRSIYVIPEMKTQSFINHFFHKKVEPDMGHNFKNMLRMYPIMKFT